MAIPGVPQTFAVETAQDMSEKLWWEIEAYRGEPDLQPKLWRAFNCAVTAWHISDWLFKQRQTEGVEVGTLIDLQNDVQRRSRALKLCKHIATASKHGGVDRRFDPTIRVIVAAKITAEKVPFEEIDRSQHWEIAISDGDGETDALQVFYKAYEFWDREILIDERRLDPDRFVQED